jgi:ribosomal protein S18 acetylase RimI-like enzyme
MKQTQYIVVPFDHQWLVEYPYQLKALIKFYCGIWEMDENFGEYRQCPECKRYFNHHQVEVKHISTCTGNSKKRHQKTPLVLAWVPEEVAADILETSIQPKDRFSGFVALNPDNHIVGFAWAKVLPLTEVEKSWGTDMANKLKAKNTLPEVVYFDELATDPNMRGLGIGTDLIRQVSLWMCEYHPKKMALLRTHENSAARSLYERVGYEICGTDAMYGYGRIMMATNPCAELNIPRLN